MRLVRVPGQPVPDRQSVRAAEAASRAANSVSGSLVGVMTMRGHRSDPGICWPWARMGSSPARSSEDFPAPDAPVTTTSPPLAARAASFAVSSAASRSRP